MAEQLWYVPALHHWHEGDLFAFVVVADSPAHGLRAGDAYPHAFRKAHVNSAAASGDVLHVDPDGTIHLTSGVKVRPGKPRRCWPASLGEDTSTVLEEAAAHVEGRGDVTVYVPVEKRRRCLDVRHPDGITLHLPLDGYGAVARDPGKAPHTYHAGGE